MTEQTTPDFYELVYGVPPYADRMTEDELREYADRANAACQSKINESLAYFSNSTLSETMEDFKNAQRFAELSADCARIAERIATYNSAYAKLIEQRREKDAQTEI